MEKMIKFTKCEDCPKVVTFYTERPNYYCSDLGKEVNELLIDQDCKLMDYPKTITEFTGGKI